MCPMRVFLVLFSALLACYFAWRNYAAVEKESIFGVSEEQSEDSAMRTDGTECKLQVASKVAAGFWTLVDMASGRYLWKGFKSFERSAVSKTR